MGESNSKKVVVECPNCDCMLGVSSSDGQSLELEVLTLASGRPEDRPEPKVSEKKSWSDGGILDWLFSGAESDSESSDEK